MQGSVLVIAELWNGKVEGVTLQMLTKGRSIADRLGLRLGLLVIGQNLENVVANLRDRGADDIFVVDDARLATPAGDVEAAAIVAALHEITPRLVLVGATLVGMERAPAIAARLDLPALTNCVDVDVEDGEIVATRPLFDGTFHAKLVLAGQGTALVALQKGATPTMPLPAKQAVVRSLAVDLGAASTRATVLAIIEEPASDIDITKADIVVSVGRGIGAREKLPLIEDLARALGGLMGCSRPLVDQGWLPRERQVGASGKTVVPKVYVACGISGASQHLAGMSESKMIVAINKDREAPIFQVAHYGIVGDLFEIVPALIAAAGKSG
jgi:electron transfer flavoprotein alpha subunit